MWKRGAISPIFAQYFYYTCISNFRSQITDSFVKCVCLIYVFLNSANLICRNISECSFDFNARKGPLCNLPTTQAQVNLCIWADWSGLLLPSYRSNAYYVVWVDTQKVSRSDCADDVHTAFTAQTQYVAAHAWIWKAYRSDCTDAQADLGLHWLHMAYMVTFHTFFIKQLRESQYWSFQVYIIQRSCVNITGRLIIENNVWKQIQCKCHRFQAYNLFNL